MSARAEILARIQAADAMGGVEIPRDYRAASAGSDPELLLDLLADRLVDYRAAVHRCAPSAILDTISAVLAEGRIGRVVVPDGFPPDWLPVGLGVVQDDPPLTALELDALDGVLSTCRVAIAETGTIVLDGGPGMGRRALSLVPDVHLVVVRSEQVVAGVPEAIAALEATRPQPWVSGPSATSDIEPQRVEGVHGPAVWSSSSSGRESRMNALFSLGDRRLGRWQS